MKLIKMAFSAGRAFWWFVVSGCTKLPETDRNVRFAICKDCELLSKSGRCLDCGCWVRIKTWLPAEHCPRNKW